jgi:hypothetical protein
MRSLRISAIVPHRESSYEEYSSGTWVITGYWMVQCDGYAMSAICTHSIGASQWIAVSMGRAAAQEEVCSVDRLIVGAYYSYHAIECIDC